MKLQKFFNTENISAFCLVFWLLVTMEGYWSWILPQTLLLIMSFFCVLIATLVLKCKKKLVALPNSRYLILFCLLLVLLTYAVFFCFIHSANIVIAIIYHLIIILPVFMLLFWNNSILTKAYCMFRKVILFFALGSIVLIVLTVLGLDELTPYIDIEDTGRVYYVNQGTFFRVHFFAVNSLKTGTNLLSGLFPRAKGAFHEGGHFALYLGMIAIIDRFRRKRLNPILIICGLLTFSVAFPILLVVSELVEVFVNKRLKIGVYCTVAALLVGTIIALPREYKEVFYYMLFERNFESVVSSTKSSGSIISGLDERTDKSARQVYDTFLHSDDVLWGNTRDVSNLGLVLSDFRGTIFRKGIIGTVAIILTLISIASLTGKRYFFLWLFPLLLIILHRSWMIDSGYYIHTIMLLGIASFQYEPSHYFSQS